MDKFQSENQAQDSVAGASHVNKKGGKTKTVTKEFQSDQAQDSVAGPSHVNKNRGARSKYVSKDFQPGQQKYAASGSSSGSKKVGSREKIACTNGEALDQIFKTVHSEVSRFANNACREENRDEFIARYTNTFKKVLQENVLVNGLPWVPNSATFENKVQDNEAVDELPKMMEKVAKQRKTVPAECVRIKRCTSQIVHKKLRDLKVVQHDVSLPIVERSSDYSSEVSETLNEYSIDSSEINNTEGENEAASNLEFSERMDKISSDLQEIDNACASLTAEIENFQIYSEYSSQIKDTFQDEEVNE